MARVELDAHPTRASDVGPYPLLHPQFPGRWSPRAMSGEALTYAEVMTLMEAARWAPSCYNAQHWRFAYARQGEERFPRFVEVLAEVNRKWAQNAGVLVAFAARRIYEHNGEDAPTHAFDTGAAWMSMALQAHHMGLVGHGMWGFDQQAARDALAVPEHYALCAMAAFGRPGDPEGLPESHRDKEKPSGRKPLSQVAFAGGFAAMEDRAG